MPRAGEEGFETKIICPYNKSHEIRKGRLQFHLTKCRKDYTGSNPLQPCPFNTSHAIPKMEMNHHITYDCDSRANYEKSIYDVGEVFCPVKDLVPVNAATVPDGGENWDNFESTGSVLDMIKEQAQEQNIYRMMQCESKAKRKNFRAQERQRHQNLQMSKTTSATSTSASTAPLRSEDPPRPTKTVTGFKSQKPSDAKAELRKHFRTLDISKKTDQSETSSMLNDIASDAASCPSLSQEVATASSVKSVESRPSTSMSMASVATRLTTAEAIIASAKRSNVPSLPVDKDGFYQINIPGKGRGRRTKQQS